MEQEHISLHQYLAELPAELRERYRREGCLLEEDERGYRGPADITGTGYQSELNRAIVGRGVEERLMALLRDPKAVQTSLRKVASRQAQQARRTTYLSRAETKKVYDAVSFLTQKFGLYTNAFITIAYNALGLTRAETMTQLLTAFLDEAGDQMKRWGYPFEYVYVHEHSREHGVHTHILATVDTEVRQAFETWARDKPNSFFMRHCGVSTDEAVDMKIKAFGSVSSAAGWVADRVQYLTKGLDPAEVDRDMTSGKRRALSELLDHKANYSRPAGPIPFRQRVGGSRGIWTKAQERAAAEAMPMLSAFGDKAWPYFELSSPHLGWEYDVYKARRIEKAVREKALHVMDDHDDVWRAMRQAGIEHPSGSDPLYLAICRQVRADRQALLLSRHPYEWAGEGWVPWWKTLPLLRQFGSRKAKAGFVAVDRLQEHGKRVPWPAEICAVQS